MRRILFNYIVINNYFQIFIQFAIITDKVDGV